MLRASAGNFWTRGRGLLGRKSLPLGEGLVIESCRQIHMFFMAFAIDVLHVKRESPTEGEVTRVLHSIAPNRIGPWVRRSDYVIELPAGTAARNGTAEGDHIACNRWLLEASVGRRRDAAPEPAPPSRGRGSPAPSGAGSGSVAAICSRARAPLRRLARVGTADLVHIGSFWYPGDFHVYLAAMDQGARPAPWLIHDRFTPEPHQPIFMFPLYVGIGKLAGPLHLAPLLVYYVGELLGRLGLLLSLYVFGAAFLPTVGQRRLALALMVMGTNLGLWGALLAQPLYAGQGESAALPLGATLEVMTLGVFLAPLHLMLGLACTVLAVAAFAGADASPALRTAPMARSARRCSDWRSYTRSICRWCLASSACTPRARWARTRRWPARAVAATALASGVALPLLLYNYWAFRLEPFWSVVYGQQNTVPSPEPLRLLLDYGLVLLLRRSPCAPGGAPRTERQWLALLAGTLLLLALYAPVPFQAPAGIRHAAGAGRASRGGIGLVGRSPHAPRAPPAGTGGGGAGAPDGGIPVRRGRLLGGREHAAHGLRGQP